jgi:hypothetical protein
MVGMQTSANHQRKISHMSDELWVSAAVRLVKMMVELHRRGYQELRIFPYEYHGISWRLCIAPREYFSPINGAFARGFGDLSATYSSASKMNYFEWTDAKNSDAEQLATLFMQRFPRICESAFGRDWQYAGWLSELSGHMSRTKEIPFVMAEYFEPGPEELTFLPLRGKDRVVGHFPLPPPSDADSHNYQNEIEMLRSNISKLQAKVSAAKDALRKVEIALK